MKLEELQVSARRIDIPDTAFFEEEYLMELNLCHSTGCPFGVATLGDSWQISSC